MPRWAYEESVADIVAIMRSDRISALKGAIVRYSQAGLKPPVEWGAEVSDLMEEARVAELMKRVKDCPDCDETELCHAHALERYPQYQPKTR